MTGALSQIMPTHPEPAATENAPKTSLNNDFHRLARPLQHHNPATNINKLY